MSEDIPAIRDWSPLYVMITVIVVMSEKVDTTITKGKPPEHVDSANTLLAGTGCRHKAFHCSYRFSL